MPTIDKHEGCIYAMYGGNPKENKKYIERKIFSNVLRFKKDSLLIIIILVAFVFILVCCASTLKYGFVKPILATSRFALFIKDTSFTFFFFLCFFKCFLQFTVNICDNVWKIKSSNMLEVYKLVLFECKKTHLLKLWLQITWLSAPIKYVKLFIWDVILTGS